MFKRLVLTTLIVLISCVGAQAAKRLGLVIGNDNYTHVAVLEKARSDAIAISETLSQLDFDITQVLDADRREMNRAIASFVAKLQPGDTALVFYAGHGVEIDGQNYLLPTGIESPANANEDFIKSESIGLTDLLARVQGTGARITLMFIDACRDNPFAGTGGRSIGGSRGLARITAPEGTFVVFSAGARQQALDRLAGEDDDPNSVFTRALLPKLKNPTLELRKLVSNVRVEVRDLALKQNHRQFPAYYDELLGEFYFHPDGVRVEEAEVNADAAQGVSGAEEQFKADFEQVRTLNSALAYEAFLEKYEGKTDLLIDIAKRRLALLQENNVDPEAEPEKPSGEPKISEPVKPKAPTDMEIIKASQLRLNALGCSVGAADGVPGPRTRRAFQRFITNTGADLRPSDFGSQNALDQLTLAEGTVCEQQVAQPKPEAPRPPAKPKEELAAIELPKPPQPTPLTGVWNFKARCPLGIRARGTSTYSWLGENVYAILTRDNFGNLGKGRVTDLGGGELAVNVIWQDGAKDRYIANLSSDRRTITGKNYANCRFTALKNN